LIIILIIAICFVLDPFLIKLSFPISSLNILLKTNLASWIFFHYQKFAKYQWIYRWNISVGNLRSELPTETFPSVIQSVTTDGNFSVRISVGNYQQKYSVGSYRLNYERKSFRIKKKDGSLTWRFWRVIVFRRHHRRIKKLQPVQWRDRCTVYITDGLIEGFEMADPYGDVSMFPSESQT
jgi:hypothetical protein